LKEVKRLCFIYNYAEKTTSPNNITAGAEKIKTASWPALIYIFFESGPCPCLEENLFSFCGCAPGHQQATRGCYSLPYYLFFLSHLEKTMIASLLLSLAAFVLASDPVTVVYVMESY